MRCFTCRHVFFDPEDKLTARGFGRCRLLPAWQYLSRISTCLFNPSRYEEKPA